MQGRIKQAQAHRPVGHDGKNLCKIIALHGKQPCKRRSPVAPLLRKNRLAQHSQPVFCKKHMFGAGQPNALGFEITRDPGLRRGIGIGPHRDVAIIVGPAKKSLERAADAGLDQWHRASQRLASRAIQSDLISLGENPTVLGGQLLGLRVDLHICSARHARQSKAAGDDGGMARLAAAFGQNALGRVHAAYIFWRSFAAHQDAGLAL